MRINRGFLKEMNETNSRNSAKAVLRLTVQHGEDLVHPDKIIPNLNALNGVLSGEINHVTNMVFIEYDEQRITLEEIRSKIQTIISVSSRDLTYASSHQGYVNQNH